MGLVAGPGRCEEASSLSTSAYIPCGQPAERMITNRGEGPYRVCAACAAHNVQNRGAEDVGPYEGPVGDAPAVLSPPPVATQTDLSAYEADAAVPAVEGENILAQITRAARELREAQADVAAAEAALKACQDRARNIEENVLPGLMDEAGQKKLTTIDGYTLERSEVLRASIPVAMLASAVAWLRDAGYGSIVKREFKLSFGKGEEAKADAAKDLLLGAKLVPTDKEFVHPQTLAAAIREMVTDGKDVPMQLLGAHNQPVVKMKPPKT